MEAVSEVICWKLDGVTVNDEAALVDAVGIASDGCAEVCLVVFRKVSGYTVKAEDDILKLSVTVRDHEGYNAATEVGDASFHAVSVFESVKCGRFAVIFADKVCRINS